MLKRVFLMIFLLHSIAFAQIVPPQDKSEGKAVTIKKNFGKINMELFCGVIRPYEIKMPNPIIIMLESQKGYTSKISYMKFTAKEGKRSLFIEAERGFANKDYSKLEFRGLKKVESKGFPLPKNAHTLIVKFQKDRLTIERVN